MPVIDIIERSSIDNMLVIDSVVVSSIDSA